MPLRRLETSDRLGGDGRQERIMGDHLPGCDVDGNDGMNPPAAERRGEIGERG